MSDPVEKKTEPTPPKPAPPSPIKSIPLSIQIDGKYCGAKCPFWGNENFRSPYAENGWLPCALVGESTRQDPGDKQEPKRFLRLPLCLRHGGVDEAKPTTGKDLAP